MGDLASFGEEEVELFDRDGFVLVDGLVGDDLIPAIHERFERLFRGDFETGVRPDEVNWQVGDDETLTRQICNGWKADRLVAAAVLSSDIGRATATLARWPGARLIQDNLLWKPPGARTIGFHRDNAYLSWFKPQQMVSCWISLDPTSEEGGTIEFGVGSHTWPSHDDDEAQFHAPRDHRAAYEAAASRHGLDAEVRRVVVGAGGGSFHHGWTWHGSGANSADTHRRALVVHCASSDARFERSGFGVGNGPIYSKYAHPGDDHMDQRHFPILWAADSAAVG